MHIGQFSMVICGFVLAIAMFLLWPSEPPPFITLVTLITAAAGYAAARYPCDAQLFDSRAFKRRVHRQFSIEQEKLSAQKMRQERLWQQN
ncbi:hypothetical protein N9N58_00465 [Alphaproteobacteria bacterium]|nr:hypothetical protein [Alphaproteobacteria bacterium]